MKEFPSEEQKDSSFNEIVIQDSAPKIEKRDILVPQANHSGFQPVPDNSPIKVSLPPSVQPLSERNQRYNQVLNYSRYIKFFALLDFLLDILFIVTGEYWLLISLVFPILGYLAGKKLSKWYTLGYLAYLVGVIVLRFVSMFLTDIVAYIILECLFVLIDLVVIYVVVKFFLMLRSLTPSERGELLLLQNGVPQSRDNFQNMNSDRNQSEAAQKYSI